MRCAPCPPGFYTSEAGATACMECGAGTLGIKGDQEACEISAGVGKTVPQVPSNLGKANQGARHATTSATFFKSRQVKRLARHVL